MDHVPFHESCQAACRIPEHVNAHPTVTKLLQGRRAQLQQGTRIKEHPVLGPRCVRTQPQGHRVVIDVLFLSFFFCFLIFHIPT